MGLLSLSFQKKISLEVNKGHSWSNMGKKGENRSNFDFAFDVRFPKKVCLKVIQGKIELHLDISFTYFGI